MEINKGNIFYSSNISRDNSVAFQGGRTNPLNMLRRKKPNDMWRDCSHIAHALGEQTQRVKGLLENAPERRVAFMQTLTSSFHSRNFMFEGSLKENSEPVFNIYNMVTKPHSAHFNIVTRSQMPFETLEQVFAHAGDKKSLEFVQIMQHDVLDGSKASGEHIVNMLKSQNRELYVHNPAEYSSYMKLNAEKEDAVNSLDILVNTGLYDRKRYDARLAVKEMMKNKNYNAVVGNDEQFIEDNYTREGRSFLDKLCSDYMPNRRGISEEDHSDILHLYASVKPENLKTRLEIIDKFKNVHMQGASEKSEIRTMRNLMDRIDSDSHAAVFVDRALGDGIKVESMEEFNRIMDIVPPVKAKVFHKNISRIVANTNLAEREQALKENVENPLFTNPRVERENARSLRPKRKDTLFEKLYKRVENSINKDTYSRELRVDRLGTPSSQFRLVEFKPDRKFAKVGVPAFEMEVLQPVETVEMPKIVQTLRLHPEARKLKVVSDVNNIIEQKLGEKTLEKQKGIYSDKATAIRLKLLPEIFDSVSATRKESSALGQRPTVENRDAVKLYEKIQGKNRKLVRYMLKKTDSEGKRCFDVKEITRVIDDADKHILDMKKEDPSFRAKDAKSYYDELYNSMVDEYGTLKRTSVRK
ncbi:MAG: hypothetical protein K6E29_04265 [Cyanobacteria bacterium RUI128]|nr:hypothetical protein [Cyanobacteria bacterium RUI128]